MSCIAQYFKLKPFIVDARTSLIVQQITRVLKPNMEIDIAISRANMAMNIHEDRLS